MDDPHDINQTRMGALAGAIFLLGLALVIWLDILIPGIFAVIWVTAIPPLLVEKGWRFALWMLTQLAIWFGGIGYMLDRGSIWPGILVLAGLSALLVAIAPPDHLEALHAAELRGDINAKRKRKRGADHRLAIPVPDDDSAHDAIARLHALDTAEAEAREEIQGDHHGKA